MYINYTSKYDLSALAGTILDQGAIGSCVENTIVSNIDLLMRQAQHPSMPLSRMQLYNDERTILHTFSVDTGSNPESTVALARDSGIAYESSFGYTPDNLYVHPSASIEFEASQHKITSYKLLDDGASYLNIRDQIAAQLDQGKPVEVSFVPQPYFFAEHGPLATQINHGTGTNTAIHDVLIVGLDDNIGGGSYIVKNSWGTSWGNNGYGTIKYSQFAPTYTTGTGWVNDLKLLIVANGFNNIDLTYTDNRVILAQDYACTLHRAGDIGGIDWWATQISQHGATNIQLVDALISSSEGQVIYGGETNSQFVDSCYMGVLGRHADSAGLSWWTTQLNNGCSRGTLMAGLIDSTNTTTTDTIAHNYLTDVTDVASYMSIALQYNGSNNALTAQELALVTSDANQTEIIKVGIPHSFGII